MNNKRNSRFNPVVPFLGFQLYRGAVTDCVEEVVRCLDAEHENGCSYVACMNPHSYAISMDDPTFHAALENARWLVPDGVGIIFAARLLGLPIRNRITGYDFFMAMSRALNQRSGSVFFLGGTEETLEKIREKFSCDFPKVTIAGTYSPPFRPEITKKDADEIVSFVRQAEPDFIWVGMGAPKQERWLFKYLESSGVRCGGAIGAVFDFYVGNVQRSHPLFQSVGLEWLPRLLREPRRLWRRTFVSAPRFFFEVLRGMTKI